MAQIDESKLRLMVVDDEADNLDLLYRTFRKEFEVFKAESAVKALQILDQEEEMAIIISDQRMPRMNGTEFLSYAAEQFPDTIRILLTGYTDVEDLVGAINTGKVFKYITKPWNPEDLRSVVLQAADTYRVLKKRTNELNRALRRESLFNAITTAIRESLDYHSMLQTIAETLGRTFEADGCLLYPVESVRNTNPLQYNLLPTAFSYLSTTRATPQSTNGQPCLSAEGLSALLEDTKIQLHQIEHCGTPTTQLFIPLTYQQEVLAVLLLYQWDTASSWSSEDIQLLEGVAQQAALAISQAKLYQRIQQQTLQMQAELAVARQIQTNLLRQTLPASENVKIQACCNPAREVGGDFFEVYAHPQGDIWLAVGDVSGKGVPAALFMASAISVLRRELAQEAPPEPNIVMQNLNRSLLEDLVSSNCFITMILARYNPSNRRLVYANAGHIYPMVGIRDVNETSVESVPSNEPIYLKVRGVPLGILSVWEAPAGEITLSEGDVLLLASDGITEATVTTDGVNGQTRGAMLRQQGLWQLVLQQHDLDLNGLLATIQARTPFQEDDQTMLSLEVL